MIYREYKPSVPEALPFVQALYAEHGAGCCLHIVLDDGNIEDSSVEFCIDYSERTTDPKCPPWHSALARMLRSMSQTQRRKLAGYPQKRALESWERKRFDPAAMLRLMSLFDRDDLRAELDQHEHKESRWKPATIPEGVSDEEVLEYCRKVAPQGLALKGLEDTPATRENLAKELFAGMKKATEEATQAIEAFGEALGRQREGT